MNWAVYALARKVPALSPDQFVTPRGGTDATLTDANLVLGYLDADFFLGGRMKLDAAAAKAAISDGNRRRAWP